jgi:hypothetical protein
MHRPPKKPSSPPPAPKGPMQIVGMNVTMEDKLPKKGNHKTRKR